MPGPPEDKDPDASLITDLSSKHRCCRKFTAGREDSHSSCGADKTRDCRKGFICFSYRTSHPTCHSAWDTEWFIIESIILGGSSAAWWGRERCRSNGKRLKPGRAHSSDSCSTGRSSGIQVTHVSDTDLLSKGIRAECLQTPCCLSLEMNTIMGASPSLSWSLLIVSPVLFWYGYPYTTHGLLYFHRCLCFPRCFDSAVGWPVLRVCECEHMDV